MGQPNGAENGKHETPQGEDIPEEFRNGFPFPEEENIGNRLGYNDMILYLE